MRQKNTEVKKLWEHCEDLEIANLSGVLEVQRLRRVLKALDMAADKYGWWNYATVRDNAFVLAPKEGKAK